MDIREAMVAVAALGIGVAVAAVRARLVQEAQAGLVVRQVLVGQIQ
jgi:hypothetical protein